MKDQLELRLGPGGVIETVYEDDLHQFAEDIGADMSHVCRALTIEWEEHQGRKGWVVRSAHNPELAIRAIDWCRWGPSLDGPLIMFNTREDAIKEELRFFWKLLPSEDKNVEE